MKFTYNWIKDFVDIKLPAEKLADKLTMAGLEVVSLDKRDGDYVFEVEITSNRPDWLSILGISREVAAVTGSRLKIPEIKRKIKAQKLPALTIEIEDKKDCSLYTARIIRDITVAPSPDWLRKRLELVGFRSVNNVVDITNYCLFELGEPLHAFDLDKVAQDKIIIRRARAGEKITTIDGNIRNIDRGSLVIADSLRPLALAGIMGGKESEVTSSTKNVLLEAALFNPVLIRRMRQAHAIHSESGYRFERGIDPQIVNKASQRAAVLMEEACGGREVYFKSSGLTNTKERTVILKACNVERVLGLRINNSKIKHILSSLGFKVSGRGKSDLAIAVPSFRQDVSLEEDLIEEVSRILGYENIPSTLPRVMPSINIRENRSLVFDIKNILIGLGLNEAATYSLIDSRVLNEFSPSVNPVGIMNPLSREQEVLRSTLIPGLTRAIAYNLNQKQEYAALFEAANVFFNKDNSPCAELRLGIALSGAKRMLFNDSAIKDELGLLNLKGVLESLFVRFKIQGYEFRALNQEGKARIFIDNEEIGYMQALSPNLLEKLGIKNKKVFVLEISLDKLLTFCRAQHKYVPLPKYPGITRDISFIFKKGNSMKDILIKLEEKGQPLLKGLRIVDYYEGKQIPQGFRGLTLECVYGSSQRTLTEEEVMPVHSLLCLVLREQPGVELRQD
ncbi:MAG: phenylalanine--tRNA ligase subunit beta [Candidatus Omnitrophota bacterium]|jgi:phenylalanyl-tRNA synthetase beta chain